MTKTRPPGTPVLVEIVWFDESSGRSAARVRHMGTGQEGSVMWLDAYEARWFRNRHAAGLPILLFDKRISWRNPNADRFRRERAASSKAFVDRIDRMFGPDTYVEPSAGMDVGPNGALRITTVDDSGIKRTRLRY